MLIVAIITYFFITIGIGVYAHSKITGGKDFINAGRSLPTVVNGFALFAIWFGSETLFGASASFAEEGIQGIIEDPLGGVLCLLIVGAFYARRMYQSGMLTISDMFRDRFGQGVEILAALLMILPFFGYIAAQLVALGLLLHTILGMSYVICAGIATLVVVVYTVYGGMLAVSITDFIQSILIIAGLIVIATYLTMAMEDTKNISDVVPDSHWALWPDKGVHSWANWIGGWLTLGLGSVVSQDIFQRVNASRNAATAVRSSIMAAILYAIFAILPIYIVMLILELYPEVNGGDLQLVIPHIVMDKMPTWVQILFFGSVASAVLSTCSGATLAASSLISENLAKPIFKNFDDKKLLRVTQAAVVFTGMVSFVVSIYENSIFDLVGLSSAFGLVSIFIPYTAALFWGYKDKAGAVNAMIGGGGVWLICYFLIDSTINPIIYGTIASALGLLLGSLYSRISMKYPKEAST